MAYVWKPSAASGFLSWGSGEPLTTRATGEVRCEVEITVLTPVLTSMFDSFTALDSLPSAADDALHSGELGPATAPVSDAV